MRGLKNRSALQVVHRVVGVVRRRVARRALALAEEHFLRRSSRTRSPGRDRACRRTVELRRRREVEQRLELGHEVDLAAALEDVDALLRRDHRIAVEVRGALLELGEVLDRLERALRAEQPLDVHAAERRRVDPMAELLRPDVADEVRRRRSCARSRGSRSSSRRGSARSERRSSVCVELLLRERRHEQPQAFDLLRD